MGFNIHILSGRNRSTNLAGHAALAASFNPHLDSSQKQPALTLKDGNTRDRVVAHPRGTGDRVLTNADIVVKYRNLTRSVIPPDRHREDCPQPRRPRRHLRTDGSAHSHRTVSARLTTRHL
jgi:hypothetical protein